MNKKLLIAIAGSAIALTSLAGCSANPAESAPSAPAAKPSASAAPTPTKSDDAATASTALGTVIVDGKGMTAYAFDMDKVGEQASACTGECASIWPAITTTSDKPSVTGVTGTVATIPAADGGKQITINGMPIYRFSKDAAAGDTKGQLVKDVWHVLAPDGTKITTPNAG